MADFEKVYSIKFNVERALKNLERLDKTVTNIENNNLVKVFGSIERKMKGIQKESKKTRRHRLPG